MTGAKAPQLAQVALRCWQAGHHGSPVAREVPQPVVSSQMAQVKTGNLEQLGHRGPSGVRRPTLRRRPHPRQVSRFAGSAMKQFAHSGRPCSSRVTGSRRAPQRVHASTRECAMQVRQTRTPSSGLSSRTTRWQRGHAGRTTPSIPAAYNRSMNRRIARNGARWPSPLSSAGWSSRAQASFWRWEGRGVTALTAAATLSSPMRGSSSRIKWWITVIGSRPSVSGHLEQRCLPLRSRDETGRVPPQTAHGSGRDAQRVQYQSCPRRWNVTRRFVHPAQRGAEIVRAPAARNPTSRSPTTRGAGERPSVRIPGRSASPCARRRDFARPPVTEVTTVRIWSMLRRCSIPATRSTARPTGSDTARSARSDAVKTGACRGCGHAWGAASRCSRRRRPLSCPSERWPLRPAR